MNNSEQGKKNAPRLSEMLQNEMRVCKTRSETTSIALDSLEILLGFLKSLRNGQHPEGDRNEIQICKFA